jgi:hypothetical protein
MQAMTEDLFDEIEDGTKVRLRVHVRPGSGRAGVVGTYGNALHVRVAAPPVAGRANEEVVKLLSDVLDVEGSKIEISGGERSADKRFVIEVSDLAELRKRLHEVVEEAAGGGTGTKHRGRR